MQRGTPCRECPKPVLTPLSGELWGVVNVMLTQARTAGMGGFTGFDLNCLPVVMQLSGVSRKMGPLMLRVLTEITPVAAKHLNKAPDE